MSRRRILAVADSDSYVKWAAATLDGLAGDASLVVLDSPVLPTAGQVDAATAGTRLAGSTPPVLRLSQLRRMLRRTPPDVLLVATTGPAAELVLRAVAGIWPRPLVVTGLPGMSLPATELALRYRSTADLFVVHSYREADEFRSLATRLGLPMRFVVNRLPFLAPRAGDERTIDTSPVTRVVFAPQAKFPETRDDRLRILRALGTLATSRPDVDVVVKLRGLAGQAQTHREELPFDVLAARHRSDPGVADVQIATGSLREFLTPGTALVTVSSTAVLEALALGLRALVLDDFGVGEHNLTAAYVGSGLLGSLDDVVQVRFRHPDPAWLASNYLHDDPDELGGAARTSPSTPVGRPSRVGTPAAHARRRLRLAAPRLTRELSRRRDSPSRP